MAEAIGALAQRPDGIEQAATGRGHDVENDVVRMLRVSPRHHAERPQMIELEGVANPPGDHMVGAGSIAAHADGADPFAPRSI